MLNMEEFDRRLYHELDVFDGELKRSIDKKLTFDLIDMLEILLYNDLENELNELYGELEDNFNSSRYFS